MSALTHLNIVLEGDDLWTPEQKEKYHSFIWFAEAWGFMFELHYYDYRKTLSNQSWKDLSDVILAYADPNDPCNVLFKKFTGSLSYGKGVHAPDMLVQIVSLHKQ